MPPELDRGGQFTAFLEHLTDGRDCRFVDAEHGANMGGGPAAGKRQPRKLAPAGNLKPAGAICSSGARHRDGDTRSVRQDGDEWNMVFESLANCCSLRINPMPLCSIIINLA
jgi:hypothetical protein